jgi:hypothetical protein
MKKTILKLITIGLLLSSCVNKHNNDDIDYKINKLKTLFPNQNIYLKTHDEFYLLYKQELYIATITDVDSSVMIKKMNNISKTK